MYVEHMVGPDRHVSSCCGGIVLRGARAITIVLQRGTMRAGYRVTNGASACNFQELE